MTIREGGRPVSGQPRSIPRAIRAWSVGASATAVPARAPAPKRLPAADDREGIAPGARRGIQSVDRALTLLGVLADATGPLTLKALAERAAIAPSHAHRFLASFVRGGLATQDPANARYDLGPLARRLGLAALQRAGVLDAAIRHLPDLVESTGLTALVGVWSERGPTIVHWSRSEPVFVTSLTLGSVLPATRSATGRALLAWMPERAIAAVIAAERADRHATARTLDAVRRAGFASVDGAVIPGLAAIACPLFDWQGQPVAAVTLVGRDRSLTAPAHLANRALIDFCRTQSEQAGTGSPASDTAVGGVPDGATRTTRRQRT